ncbi:MAG: TonB-dependent receptor [Bacteroidia bacterium]|nr:TonB-dependent receptor [Bacteroidia bacterium]
MLRKLPIFILLTLTGWGLMGQNGIIKGRMFDQFSNEPLEFGVIVVEGANTGAYTDSTGNFEIKGLPAGLYNVEGRYQGFKSQTIYEVQVTNSKPAVLEFALISEIDTAREVKIVASPFNKTEESPVSIRTIGVNEIQRNPGGNRDISRVIQSLPGVATGVAFRNDIIIRGGAPNENRFYLDGIEVPNINHFATQGASGGPTGLINVDFIREVDFYSGAFPSNRGNTLSSVMEIKLRNGRDDKVGFTATVGSSDLGLTLEGPIGKKKNTTFLVSGRRSYLQWLFQALALPFLPNYNDFQFKTKTKLSNKSELTFIGLGAIDNFALNLKADSTEEQRYILGYLPVNTQWNYTVGANYKQFTDKGYWTIVASRNMLNNRVFKYEDNDETLPLIQDYTSQEIENKFRIENTLRTNGFKINVGANYEFARYTNSTFQRIASPAGEVIIDYQSNLKFHKYGAFGQISRKFFSERLVLSTGFRLDGNSYSGVMANPFKQFSPRFSASWNFAPKLNLNFNTGIYYQLPPYTVMGYRNETNQLINRDNGLSYIKSNHLVAGLEYNYSPSGKITVEGFYKTYQHYPFLTRDSISLANQGAGFGVIGNAPATSSSQGRSYGVEFLAQQKLWKGFFGIVSYTFVRSEFTNGQGQYRPSAWDNRHIVSLTGGKKFGKNYEIGFRWRWYGGTPYTPYDETTSLLISNWNVSRVGLLDYSQLNTLRTNGFNQLDVRIDKKWFFKKWSLNLYFDLQNAYNAKSQQQPYLDVVKDADGNPIPDPNNPGYYQANYLQNTAGTILPSIGIVVQL